MTRGLRRSRSLRASAVLLSLALAGCGGDAAREARARAALEEEFGPRGGASDSTPAVSRPAAAESTGEDETPSGGSVEPSMPDPARAPAGGAETGASPPPAAPTSAPRTDTVVAPPAEPPPGIDVDSLLAGAERAYSGLRSLRATFTQRTENRLLERTREGTGRWYQAGRDRFLMDFTDPPDDAYVADGEFLWVYQPSATPGQVIKSELARGAGDTGTADLLGQILREARTAYDGVWAGRESVAGVDTHHIVLTPRTRSSYVQVDVWIASRDRLVRRFRIEEENETIRTVTLADLEPNVPLADSLFRFTPPPGVTVFTP